MLKIRLKQKPCKIIIGAGGSIQNGWISTDVDTLNILNPEDWKRCFSDNSIDAILAERVWEHLSNSEAIFAARMCFKYIRPAGYLRVAVPDGLHPDPKYIEWVKPGGIGAGADDHRALYNYKSFKRIFELVGFKVELLEYFDESGNFYFKEWDPDDGKVVRSKRFDERNNKGNLNYTSIILDAKKAFY